MSEKNVNLEAEENAGAGAPRNVQKVPSADADGILPPSDKPR